jgi:hypothetical protein
MEMFKVRLDEGKWLKVGDAINEVVRTKSQATLFSAAEVGEEVENMRGLYPAAKAVPAIQTTNPKEKNMEPRIKMNLFCKPYLRAESTRLLRNGTFKAHVLEHIKRFGESPVGEYNVRLHGDGKVITIGNATEPNNGEPR